MALPMAASKLLDGIPKDELLDAFVKTVSMQDLKNHVKKMEKAKTKTIQAEKKRKRGAAYAPTREEWATYMETLYGTSPPVHVVVATFQKFCAERIGCVVQMKRKHVDLEKGTARPVSPLGRGTAE